MAAIKSLPLTIKNLATFFRTFGYLAEGSPLF